MRTLIVNATVVDGTGAPPRSPCTVVIEDHLIEEVIDRWAPYYDRADTIFDAHGGFVLPGLIDHHAHGLTRGPLMILGQPALSDARVWSNLNRLLRQGVTTALNVDGFATVEDASAVSRFHPLLVRVATLHLPTTLAWASAGILSFGGVLPQHEWTLERMVRRGALAIGEAGPGLDPHWADYALVPRIVEMLGGTATPGIGPSLRRCADAGDRDGVAAALALCGVPASRHGGFDDLYTVVTQWRGTAEASLYEAIYAANDQSLPLIFHHTPGTYAIQLESAALNGERHIAAHSNFQCKSVDDAVSRAREIRQLGGLVDIMSGDCFSAQEFDQTPRVTFGMLAAGVVDLVSTDYAGGFWDSMLLLIEQAALAGAISIGEGVRLVTSAPGKAIPGLAPDRGVVGAGMVADLVLTEPGRLSAVRRVFVAGRDVAMPANDWS